MTLIKWQQDGYYKKQGEVLDKLLKHAIEAQAKGQRVDMGDGPHGFRDTIERVDYKDLIEEDFIKRFEFGSKPVII